MARPGIITSKEAPRDRCHWPPKRGMSVRSSPTAAADRLSSRASAQAMRSRMNGASADSIAAVTEAGSAIIGSWPSGSSLNQRRLAKASLPRRYSIQVRR